MKLTDLHERCGAFFKDMLLDNADDAQVAPRGAAI